MGLACVSESYLSMVKGPFSMDTNQKLFTSAYISFYATSLCMSFSLMEQPLYLHYGVRVCVRSIFIMPSVMVNFMYLIYPT